MNCHHLEKHIDPQLHQQRRTKRTSLRGSCDGIQSLLEGLQRSGNSGHIPPVAHTNVRVGRVTLPTFTIQISQMLGKLCHTWIVWIWEKDHFIFNKSYNTPGGRGNDGTHGLVSCKRSILLPLGPSSFVDKMIIATQKRSGQQAPTSMFHQAQIRPIRNIHRTRCTLQGINISHLGKRKIIFKMPFFGDMLVPWRVPTLPWHCSNMIILPTFFYNDHLRLGQLLGVAGATGTTSEPGGPNGWRWRFIEGSPSSVKMSVHIIFSDFVKSHFLNRTMYILM